MQTPVTVAGLITYLSEQMGNGNSKCFVALDRRGLQYFDTKIHENIAIGVPPEGETHGDGVVYVRAIF